MIDKQQEAEAFEQKHVEVFRLIAAMSDDERRDLFSVLRWRWYCFDCGTDNPHCPCGRDRF